MSLRKRGRFWHYQFTVAGRPYSGNTGATVKRDAETIEKRLRDEAIKSGTVESLHEQQRKHLFDKKSTHINDAWRCFCETPQKTKPSGRRLAENKSRWDDFILWLCGNTKVLMLHEVTQEMAERYITHIDTHGRYGVAGTQELATATRNELLETCKRVFRVLQQQAGVVVNPFGDIPKVLGKAVDREAFTAEELKVIGDNSKGTDKAWIYHIFIVGICTGLREGDICMLRWGDVNPDAGWISIAMQKTGKAVEIPIVPSLRAYLNTLRCDCEYVWPALAERYSGGGRCNIGVEITKFLEQTCNIVTTRVVKGRSKPAKIKDVHSLRHTFCYLAAINGIPLPVVQSVVGHMSPKMTQAYMNHAGREEKALLMQAMPNHLESAKQEEGVRMAQNNPSLKLPLDFVEHNWSDTSIYDADENCLATFSIAGEATEATQDRLEREMGERTRFIVRACNSHYAMLEALEEATAMLKAANLSDGLLTKQLAAIALARGDTNEPE